MNCINNVKNYESLFLVKKIKKLKNLKNGEKKVSWDRSYIYYFIAKLRANF